MKKLVLIDGNAILHRAFHAYPGLTDPKGNLVNAVYGFSSMFLKILQDQNPDYIVVCFDRPTPTFRKQLYVGYQAKRPQMDEGLSLQIVKVHDVLEKMGVAMFEVDGYEADDLIGTLATQAVKKNDDRKLKVEDSILKIENGSSIHPQSSNLKNPSSIIHHLPSNIEVLIVTGDRDMMQLVNSHVKILMPLVGMTTTALYDSKAVEEKFGLKPHQFIDYKALVGDASDNYPGVSGIGPKTASNLLKEYETFENLYEHIAELPEKISLKLANDAEQAALAKKLATIVTDAPITLDLEKCSIEQFDIDGAREAFEGFGFNSLIRRLFNETNEPEGPKETKAKEKIQVQKPAEAQLELL